MNLHTVDIIIEIAVFLFAISVHESAHAWMALRNGDPTAFMLGRVTLNPIKHIDPVGTILLPAIAVITHFPIIGWAKPTPVNPRNFKNVMRSDILTSIAGPISNFLVAIAAVLLLALVSITSAHGHQIIQSLVLRLPVGGNSVLIPISRILYITMFINVFLAVFNLIPIPPLDGSHVLRHFLRGKLLRAYDIGGIFALIVLMVKGGGILSALFSPFIWAVNTFLIRI